MSQEIIDKAQKLWGEQNEEEAISLLKPLVDAGDVDAKSNLGLILAHSLKGNVKDNIHKGEVLLNEACESGEPSACHNLGTLWLGTSPSIGKDYKKAAYFYLRARELGGPIADEGFYQRWENEINC